MNDEKNFIKDVAIAFNIKCRKYYDPSPELYELLFEDAYRETVTIYELKGIAIKVEAINSAFAE